MHITHLSLTSFRNYLQLDFELPPDITVLWGANAQGKTNLLESICFLATGRFSRPVPDREIINRDTLEEKIPSSHLHGDVHRNDRNITLEIFLRPRTLVTPETGESPAIHKHIKVNGIPMRTADLLGQLNMVMFSPRDIDLITDEPSLRRRYMDITNSQVDQHYLRSLQRYNKVLVQRNHLLRQISSGQSHPDEINFWDEELVKTGSYLISRRLETVKGINELAIPIHDQLSGGQELLSLRYINSVENISEDSLDAHYIENAFHEALRAARGRELARGVSLIGPHRDDLLFFTNDINIGHYGSRGQQRTVALSLKLAEAGFLLDRTGETPVLLLDDVLSELDKERRRHLLEAISGYQQVLITTTDLDRFPAEFLNHVRKLEVVNGILRP